MKRKNTTQSFYQILMVALLLTLASCGGGGSSGGADPVTGGGGGGGGSNPVFGGVTSLEQAGTTRMVIYWAAASDDVSSSNNITYNIYLATATGAQNFTAPTAVSTPGAAYVVLSGLVANTGYFVVVRAEDEAMNEDTNTMEMTVSTAATVTSLSGDVQPIMDNDCTLGCHTTGITIANLDLAIDMTYGEIVNVNSRQCSPVKKMVVPNDAIASYFINKLTGISMCSGSLMPSGAIELAAADIQTIKNWIWDGALDN